eukprot:5737439-Amphidinium_carterae.1
MRLLLKKGLHYLTETQFAPLSGRVSKPITNIEDGVLVFKVKASAVESFVTALPGKLETALAGSCYGTLSGSRVLPYAMAMTVVEKPRTDLKRPATAHTEDV